jgi:amino acid permease
MPSQQNRAAFADAPSALLPGAFFTFLMGAIFGYYFLLIGRTCRLTRTATYREVWEYTMGDSEVLATLVSMVNTIKPALGNLAYSMVLADTCRSLFAAVEVDVSRTASLILITVVGLLPLCLLKNLSVLAPTSMLGVFGFAATTIVMGIRYFDGSYAEGGVFATVRFSVLQKQHDFRLDPPPKRCHSLHLFIRDTGYGGRVPTCLWKPGCQRRLD